MTVASVESIRAQFPALERRAADGQHIAYFDGPGGTQVPRSVAEAMVDYLYHHNANTHWAYPTSAETDALIDDARAALADFVNGAPHEIAFGANMTTLLFHLSRGLGRAWGPGDEVVVTELDHHANVAPWQALAVERGITVRMVPMRVEDGRTDFDALARAITQKTKLVAIGAASNALGTVTDVAAVTRMAKAVGALVFVDAVHWAPHHLVDVQAIGCDALGCSAYKFYGPHVGVLWVKRELLERVDVPKLAPAPDNAPDRLETGTQNHEGIVGAGAAVNFLASLAGSQGTRRERLAATFDELHRRGDALLTALWTGLEAVPGVTLYGPRPGTPRTPTLSFTVKGHTSTEVARALVPDGLYVSDGDFYAATIIERLGVEGLVRLGCSVYTTAEEVARVVGAVARVAK
ncbi:MAG: cysteine desulfurase [Gemmatimonadetes bacterium]|nr:cysteine desulfurase [Gemmatimonadota bacterium]